MAKIIAVILFVIILLGNLFSQPKPFGYKISGNGDIISDIFLIKEGFVLDSAFLNNQAFRFEYNDNGRLKRDVNFIKSPIIDSVTGRYIMVPGFRDYFYNERGDVDSVRTGIYNVPQPKENSSGYRINYTYDSEGKILSKIYSSNGNVYKTEENNYDSSGNLILNKIILTNYDTTTNLREYDSQNRLIKTIKKEDPHGINHNYDQTLYQYDSLGNINCTLQEVNINGLDTVIHNTYNYTLEFDQSGRLIRQVNSRSFNPADSTWEDPYEVLCDYDEYSRMLRMGDPAWFRYNADGNLDSLVNVHPVSSGYLANKGRLLDSYGNIITLPEYYGIITFYYSYDNYPNSIEDELGIDYIPKEYSLFQNYPNPFNPSTTISYQIPQDGMVTLKIYDALGKEVTALVNEFKTSGRYNITFNASHLASGVYIYKIQSGDFTASKKLVLMK